MKSRTTYVFGAALAGMALGGVPGIVDRAHGAVITNANFTFESDGATLTTTVTVTSATNVGSTGTTLAATTGASVGPFAAEIGTGSVFGVHAASNTVYSLPAGNGSAKSLSSNVWAPGDYYQFNVPTTGIQNILVSFDQGASSTGPHSFSFLYSIDGTNFQTLASYPVLSTVVLTPTGTQTATSGTTNFGGGTTVDTRFNLSFDLSTVTGLNNDPNAEFRLVDSVTAATAGTNRVDNFVVSGASAVPEPASLTLLTVSAAGLLLRKRR